MSSIIVDRDRLQKQKALVPKIVKALFISIRSANEVSRLHRQQVGRDDKSLTYGEICPESFLQILALAVRNLPINQRRRSFVDLGSGTGKAVVTAVLSLFFTKAQGIEIVPGLHTLAVSVHETLSAALLQATEHQSELITVSHAKFPSKEKRKKEKELTDTELILHITEIIRGAGATSMELIGNTIVKQFGHKVYTSALKKYGKLSKCIAQHPDKFVVAADDGTISLVTGTGTAVDVGVGDITADNMWSMTDSEARVVETTSSSTTSSSSSTAAASSSSSGSSNNTTTTATTITSSAAAEPADDHHEQRNTASIPVSMVDAVTSVLLDHPGSFHYFSPLPEISLKCGDIFNPCTGTDETGEVPWWEEATVAYAASLLFSDDMLARLLERVRLMTPHSIFISLRPLPLTEEDSARIILIEESFFKMSWQMAKVYFYMIRSS